MSNEFTKIVDHAKTLETFSSFNSMIGVLAVSGFSNSKKRHMNEIEKINADCIDGLHTEISIEKAER